MSMGVLGCHSNCGPALNAWVSKIAIAIETCKVLWWKLSCRIIIELHRVSVAVIYHELKPKSGQA